MKFSDLTSNMRSMLTALCACHHLNTEQLGNGCVPKLSPAAAANVLNELRHKGLIFSMQKPTGQAYAAWSVSEFGHDVFMGRPDGNVQASPSTQGPNMAAAKKEAVLNKFIIGAPGQNSVTEHSREDALRVAQEAATRSPGTDFKVYELIAVASLPVPTAQITLL